MRQLKSEKQQTSCCATSGKRMTADTFEWSERRSAPIDLGMRCEGRRSDLDSVCIPRKEVIQPHLPVRLPCYDFTPIIDPTLDACPQLPG